MNRNSIPDSAKREPMKVKTNLKAGAMTQNHNSKLVRGRRNETKKVRVKTCIRAGAMSANHNEEWGQDRKSLNIRTNLTAGGLNYNHNVNQVRPRKPLKVKLSRPWYDKEIKIVTRSGLGFGSL